MQMVVVSEPRLVAQLLHNSNLAKPTYPVMVHFRQVWQRSRRINVLPVACFACSWHHITDRHTAKLQRSVIKHSHEVLMCCS